MTIFSVAQATTHLGIDAKTLHRWLSDAHLCLLPHPEDARQKALSQDHLLLLARLHQRLLPALSQAEPPPLPDDPEPFAAQNARLDALQAQISALQQQITDLTCLLQAPAPPHRLRLMRPGLPNALPSLPPLLLPSPKRLPSPPMSSPASSMQKMDSMP